MARRTLVASLAAVCCAAVLMSGCQKDTCGSGSLAPPVAPELHLTRRQRDVVSRYAPVILQDTDPRERNPPYWDFITAHDFDGNRVGRDNEDNLRRLDPPQLPAVVYYALTESQTHYFIVYSFFHPLDWDRVPWWIPKTWHENDMENVQVVVRKASREQPEAIVATAIQAHARTRFEFNEDFGRCRHHRCRTNPGIALAKADGTRTHPVVYVQYGGHGIYSASRSAFVPARVRRGDLERVFVLHAAEPGQGESYVAGKWDYQYALRSTYAELWYPSQWGLEFGDGELLDGSFSYSDDGLCHPAVPRHYDSFRPGRDDAGILPFAFSHDLHSSDLGALFFDPARKYPKLFQLQGRWSTRYLHNPYRGILHGSRAPNTLKRAAGRF